LLLITAFHWRASGFPLSAFLSLPLHGTGACAVLVASVLNGVSERKATVKLLGGDLIIEWNENNNHVYMTGPAVKVFEGEVDLNEL